MANHPDQLRRAITKVRNANGFKNEIHWTKQSEYRNKVYREVAAEVVKVDHWEYKATCIPVKGFDLSYYSGRDDLAYNRMVRHGIDAALRFPRIKVREKYDISIDAKQRLAVDNCLRYLREHYEESGELSLRPVEIRELDSKQDDLIQLCDLFSGAKNSLLAKNCGERKLKLAAKIWRPPHCREFMSNLGSKK